MKYIPFTDDEKRRAASVNLEEFLRQHGERLIRSGHEKRMESDRSVTVRGNRWFDHSAQEGGGSVSFVRKRFGLSYPEAVALLLNRENIVIAVDTPSEETPFTLPPKHSDVRRVFAYLAKQRAIDRDVVGQFVRDGLLYESAERSKGGSVKYHNAVFVGLDEHNVARHAHKRSLNSQGKSYKGNVSGSDPAYSFRRIGQGERLYVFEAPIDLMSFISLHPDDWQSYSYVSLCGVSEHALMRTLDAYPQLRRVTLCLDYDNAGIAATTRLSEKLRERGYSDVSVLRPQNKDWNDDLHSLRHPNPADFTPLREPDNCGIIQL